MRPWLPALLIAHTAFAMPNPDGRFRPGANHHKGDDSFVARFDRMPNGSDDEHVRMRVHLEAVRAWLAERPATEPALAARRAELLGYLDEYIAKGVTPQNEHLPWRTAVFIDDAGAICAVGYLIERSVGRALPERIAHEHRYDFLEDIAAAMPEVNDWIRDSGFTLEELASIQPAYASPNVETWHTWDLVNHAPADGPFEQGKVAGTFKRKSLEGVWTVKNDADVVVGRGELHRGTGTWRSFYGDGKRVLAEGPYVHNVAHGAWTFFHPSGNVAAEGEMVHGMRQGRWRFYNDTPDKTLIASGEFGADGSVVGTWKHFDTNGELLARTYSQARGMRIDVVPTTDGIRHEIYQFNDGFEAPVIEYEQTLERLSLGDEQIFVHTTGYRQLSDGSVLPAMMYDADGFALAHTDAGWTASNCHWSKKRTHIARSGDLAWLHEMLFAESAKRAVTTTHSEYGNYREMNGDKGPQCDAPVAVDAARGARLDKLVAPRNAMRAQSPTFVRELVLNEELDGEVEGDDTSDDEQAATVRDLRRVLAAYTIGYVEWPHIDGRFERVFRTMAGRYKWEWAGSEPEADDSDPLENARIARERAR